MQKKMQKIAKNGPTWPQDPPKMSSSKSAGGLRVALSGPYLESKKL